MATGCSSTSSSCSSSNTIDHNHIYLNNRKAYLNGNDNVENLFYLNGHLTNINNSTNTTSQIPYLSVNAAAATNTARSPITYFPEGFFDNDTTSSLNSLKIKTKSIENTLLPLVNQISNLVNFRENQRHSCSVNYHVSGSNCERATNALLLVGQAVNLAVERFVVVGEAIAYENPSIKIEMLEACKEARYSGITIKSQTEQPNSLVNVIGLISSKTNNEKLNLIQAANNLLNSVTKVLLLADVVIINQILHSKNKVSLTLTKLEHVLDFDSFISLFTQYGADLIELAQLSGERQNDLKDEKRRSQLSSARWILEKSTVMILSSTKAYLKHTECECSKENVSLVYSFLQQALDSLEYVIIDSGSLNECSAHVYHNVPLSRSSNFHLSFINAYRQFEDLLELYKNRMITDPNVILNSLNVLVDSTQDFTDSMFIKNDQREKILLMQSEIREKTVNFLREEQLFSHDRSNQTQHTSTRMKTSSSSSCSKFLVDNLCTPLMSVCEELKKLLQSQSMLLANNLFRENQDASLLNCIKTYSLSNQYDVLIETLDKFKEYSDHVLEICKLLRHISELDIFEVTCEHHHNVFDNLSKMIQSSSGTTALFPTCKSALENLHLFCESWENQINDLSVLVKEMQDFIHGVRSNKSVYLSLPRPGKHGTSARITNNSLTKSSKLDSNEQAKIAKLGLEMRLIQSEMDAETDKWNQPQNEIVKIAKLMSEMAYEIHLFTRGQGSLKTTQDLFNRAEIFLQNGVYLYSIVKEFQCQIPNGFLKSELVQMLEQIPINFKQLKSRLKKNTIGKTATFNKVDYVIQDTRDFMNLITKLVTCCFLCCNKYNVNCEPADDFNFIDKNLYNDDKLFNYSNLNAAHANADLDTNCNFSKFKYGEHLLDLQKRLSSYSLPQTRPDTHRSHSLQRNIYS